MKINFAVRFKNPIFLVQLFMSVLLPILAYAGLTVQDMTSWGILLNTFVEAFKNPYVVGTIIVSVWGVITDPTTKGFKDSERVLSYHEPK